ncbi:MAG: hypothetical protein KDK36_21235, partial [Leptospiraceae bacterium]|nr:hypothetical protein [Leptospiraceae bacterium]
MEENIEKTEIYLEPKMDQIPEYYDRDIIKVLTKNPKEIYVFWGISLNTFENIKNFFGLEESKIHYK